MIVDALGNSVHFTLTGGQVHDSKAAVELLSGVHISGSKALINKDSKVDTSTGTPLALGAALGGIAGKELFSVIKGLLENGEAVGGVQAVALGIITVGTLLYTVNKSKISTKQLTGIVPCVFVGAVLGIMSSFLGIGGGPINLVVLGFCSAWTARPLRQTVCTSFSSASWQA